MQDVRGKNQKAIGHSICQMDQMDLQFSIGLLRVHQSIHVQYLCKMSEGKIKRPLDIPFVKWIKWISNFPLDFCVSIGSNGQMECPLASNGSIGTMHQPNKSHVKVADRNNASTGSELPRFYHYVINRLQDPMWT